jgi:hypothetical protein
VWQKLGFPSPLCSRPPLAEDSPPKFWQQHAVLTHQDRTSTSGSCYEAQLATSHSTAQHANLLWPSLAAQTGIPAICTLHWGHCCWTGPKCANGGVRSAFLQTHAAFLQTTAAATCHPAQVLGNTMHQNNSSGRRQCNEVRDQAAQNPCKGPPGKSPPLLLCDVTPTCPRHQQHNRQPYCRSEGATLHTPAACAHSIEKIITRFTAHLAFIPMQPYIDKKTPQHEGAASICCKHAPSDYTLLSGADSLRCCRVLTVYAAVEC